jgi:hypothetical protein
MGCTMQWMFSQAHDSEVAFLVRCVGRAYVEEARSDGQFDYVVDMRWGPEHIFNFGACYKPSPHQQIDFHLSVGLSAAAPEYSVGLGYSARFQVIHKR